MFSGEEFVTASGVLLTREISGENSLWIRLFLKEFGIVNVTARKPSGETEPFIWGIFSLKKKHKGKNYIINETEIIDDMFKLRRQKETIITALNWSNLILKYLISEQPDDELLANLYWNMKLLCDSRIPPDVPNWRFLWKWLENWGLAPDFVKFHIGNKFNNDEILFLANVLNRDTKNIIKLFSEPVSKNIRENIFKISAKLAVQFLNEK